MHAAARPAFRQLPSSITTKRPAPSTGSAYGAGGNSLRMPTTRPMAIRSAGPVFRLHESMARAGSHDNMTRKAPPAPAPEPDEPTVTLSPEQSEILDLAVNQRKSLFFTGSAGTGKSFVMREIIRQLRPLHPYPDEIAVTASTGMAACSIGGCTLHSFAGIGLGSGTAEALLAFAMRSKKAQQRWRRVKVLVIDEISMIEGPLFDKIEFVARGMRGINLPFGGVQLVICGDFMQLPPVSRTPVFCFEAKTWATSVPLTIKLTHVFRQSDPRFVDILNEMRTGKMSEKSISMLKSLSHDRTYSDGIEPTTLLPTRREVEEFNEKRLAMLSGFETVYQASVSADDPATVKKAFDSVMAQEKLRIKIGAQVMLLVNKEYLVNGMTGLVTAIDDKTGLPVVRFNLRDGLTSEVVVKRKEWRIEGAGGVLVATVEQVPLVLSYALSIHKSQGQTLPRVKVDLKRVFEKGQAYVALSRATNLEGLQVLNFDASKVAAHDRVVEFDRKLQICSASQ